MERKKIAGKWKKKTVKVTRNAQWSVHIAPHYMLHIYRDECTDFSRHSPPAFSSISPKLHFSRQVGEVSSHTRIRIRSILLTVYRTDALRYGVAMLCYCLYINPRFSMRSSLFKYALLLIIKRRNKPKHYVME